MTFPNSLSFSKIVFSVSWITFIGSEGKPSGKEISSKLRRVNASSIWGLSSLTPVIAIKFSFLLSGCAKYFMLVPSAYLFNLGRNSLFKNPIFTKRCSKSPTSSIFIPYFLINDAFSTRDFKSSISVCSSSRVLSFASSFDSTTETYSLISPKSALGIAALGGLESGFLKIDFSVSNNDFLRGFSSVIVDKIDSILCCSLMYFSQISMLSTLLKPLTVYSFEG